MISKDDIDAFSKDAYPETIVYTHKTAIACSGEDNTHPRVWVSVPEIGNGYAKCGYCDIKFMRAKANNE